MIVYYSPAADSFIVGDLIDKNLQSVTQKRKADMMQAKLKEIPLDKAVKIGNGKHQVIEFTDPDCPYCRKAAEYLKDKDVTKYVFLRPIPQLHPKAAAKAKYILASKDRASAYYDVMSGKLDKDDNLDKQTIGEDAITLFDAQNATADRIGIYSTPTFWIDGKMVAGANFKLMDELLK
jgi:thiol:disulfide interchange protein DsbC